MFKKIKRSIKDKLKKWDKDINKTEETHVLANEFKVSMTGFVIMYLVYFKNKLSRRGGGYYVEDSAVGSALKGIVRNFPEEMVNVIWAKSILLVFVVLVIFSCYQIYINMLRIVEKLELKDSKFPEKLDVYLEQLGAFLMLYFFLIASSYWLFVIINKLSPGFFNFNFVGVDGVSIVLGITGYFLTILSRLMKRGASLQEEVNATV